MSLRGNRTAPSWRIWAACGDGVVRGYLVLEKSLETQQDVLDASACTCTCTHLLVGQSHDAKATSNIGCSQVHLARNYVGCDEMAGDLLVTSMDLTGRIRLWLLSETMDEYVESFTDGPNSNAQPLHVKPNQEFVVDNATGTCFQLLSPNITGVGDVLLAVARLDGTIAIVSTGITTPKTSKEPNPAGTILDVWSKTGPITMSCDSHPSKKQLAVGRQDGLVELLGESPHRLIHHEAPVRAVKFSPDANLLVTASDDGMVAVWDLGRPVPALVNHVLRAHTSWILSMVALGDSRRFVTCGADRKLHVWGAGQMHQSKHTFNSDDTVWTIHAATTSQRGSTLAPPRLISGSENGVLQIYSLEN
jgi:WD40 repeat protein